RCVSAVLFFFSSRRRHTRFSRDWSSDVCSSDLIYKGFLNIDEYGCLECGDSYLISDVESDFKKGDKVFVRYFLSDKEITEEQARSEERRVGKECRGRGSA